jgi:phosphoesterase RecJ-like protein
LLAGHRRPDGDCIGSEGALARGLQALGKTVHILNPDHPGPQFEFFYDQCPFGVYDGGALPDHDVAVLLDINELSRCGGLEEPLRAAPSRKLVIDHHPFVGEPWWDASFVDISASATGILVWYILHELGAPIDEVVARAVFAALVTDTGWFRYSNTDAETMAVASELVRGGVDPAAVFNAIHQRSPRTEPGALAGLLERVEYFADGRLAVVDHPLGNGAYAALVDSDPMLDIVRAVEDVEVVLYVREIEPGLCKLSARSKTTFNVNALARRFGGGGHVKASGATIEGKLSDVKARLVESALTDFVAGAGA